MAAIEEALGENHRKATEMRLAPLEELLAPTLKALPKNEYGKFGHKAARYALHRLFVQRHAWFVKGLDSNGDLGGNQTALEMLQDGVPDQIQRMFESRLGSHGLDSHEVAVMAATLENLAHTESMERLRLAHKAMIPQGSMNKLDLSPEVADSILDTYMAAYVMGMDTAMMEEKGGKLTLQMAESSYPGFEDVKKFVREIRSETISRNDATISFMQLSTVASRIGDRYGRWQHFECDDLKKKLLSIEDDGTGRVSLTKFYRGAVDDGHWQFSESPEYLRSLGALDETDPANPRVMVSNYLLAPSNCVASSQYYQVCCLDECEELLDHIEQKISAPAATPGQIASLVAAMASSTTPANREIPARLLQRLEDIAGANEGMVPLHGRMFAQWMHHAYPRECPYPHMSGTLTSMRAAHFEKATGIATTMSDADLRDHIAGAVEPVQTTAPEIQWSHEDEFYVEQAPPKFASGRSIVRFVVFFIPACSMAFWILSMGRTAGAEANLPFAKEKAHYV